MHPQNLDPERKVGLESQKSYREKVESGFFERFLTGDAVLDIGFAGHEGDGQPIVPQAIGVDINYPGYDGVTLPFPDLSQDAIYSSHCYEHIDNYADVLRDWYRVLKVGGHIVIAVPHQHLFEKRTVLPSPWNMDHKRFYTPASLLAEVESVFAPNTMRVRYLRDNDQGYNYDIAPLDPACGCYEIELVLQKIGRPHWNLEDGTSRRYGAEEFTASTPLQGWWFETDFSGDPGYWIWGPYVRLQQGRFRVELSFESFGLEDGAELAAAMTIDIGQEQIASGTAKVLAGISGTEELRSGRVQLEFENQVDGAMNEFRVQLHGKAFEGRLRFLGAEVKYLGYTRWSTAA